jgi:methylenetetrahydrofolate reductase (NADPH)
MDAGVVRRYMARLAEHGLAGELFVLIGVVPLRSARSARWIRDKLYGAIIPDAVIARLEAASDPAAEGRRICLDMVRELAAIPHVAGCHIMAPGNDAVVPEIIVQARESVSRLTPA